MSNFGWLVMWGCLLSLLHGNVAAESALQQMLVPGLGKAAAHRPELLVLPDGQGLPAGSGTAAAGKQLYLIHCASCHGVDGNNGPNDKLVGGVGSLSSQQPTRTVGSYWPVATTLFDFIRRAMPYLAPGTLSDADVYAVTAYVLYLNDIVSQTAHLDATSLPQVVMPNANGFISDYPFNEKTVVHKKE